MSQLPIPGKPEEITPAWFTAVFRENGIITSGAVAGVQLATIGQNQGFTGVIVRAQIQYTSCTGTAPSSVVVKLPTASRDTPSAYRANQQQDAMAVRRYFERCAREVMFYQHIAPIDVISLPQLYYGAADSTTERVILVLADLHAARIGDVLRRCSPQDAALVIDQLAPFHARWWNHQQLESLPWLPSWGGDSDLAQNRYIHCIEPFLRRFGQRLPRRVRAIIESLATSYGAVRTRLQQAPVTLVHGDLHLDNIFFHMSRYHSPVTIIDWQSVASGCCTIDLALFLFGSLDTRTNRAVERDLLRRYHTLLLAGGVTGYDFPRLVEDCRLALLWLLGTGVVWRGSLDLDNLSGREYALVEAGLTEDSFSTLLDYDAGSLLPL